MVIEGYSDTTSARDTTVATGHSMFCQRVGVGVATGHPQLGQWRARLDASPKPEVRVSALGDPTERSLNAYPPCVADTC
jgi:hypothetical protein